MPQPPENDDAPKDDPHKTPVDDGATIAFGDSTPGTVKKNESQNKDAAPGDKVRYLGDYELLQEIARGGMGVVFKARQTTLNRIVAVKMILAGQLAGEQEIDRFHAEAQSAAKLDHPGIVPIYEVGRHEGHHYFSMGFVDGCSLGDRIKRGRFQPKEAAEMTRKIALAIAYAHRQGVVHRDLKPANVLIDQQGEPRVTDFGLAKQVRGDSNLTATGQVVGTPAYMPPEQAAGELDRVDAQSDVYSLGALLYCLLTGDPPFQAASTVDTLLKVLKDEPAAPRQLIPSVPRDLETICLKCLSKEKNRRYGSADELAKDLQRYLSDEPIEARPASLAYKFWRKAKRNRATSLATAAAVIALIAGAAFYGLFRQRSSEFAHAAQTAKGAQEALERIQGAQGIHQLAVPSFKNLTGNKEDEFLSDAFADTLVDKLSAVATLKVVGNQSINDARAELGLPLDTPLDSAAAERLGKHLVIDHVVLGGFQRFGNQIKVSARIINTSTDAVDHGGMMVQGKYKDEQGQYTDDVLALQDDLANQCVARLTGSTATAVQPLRSEDSVTTIGDKSSTEEPAPEMPAAPVLAVDSRTPQAPSATLLTVNDRGLAEPSPEAPATTEQLSALPAPTDPAEKPAASVEAWVLLGQGQHALRNRDYDEAIRLLSQAIEADPNLAKAYRALGQAYQQSERNEDAVEAFKKALHLDKDDLVSLTYFNMLSGRIAEGLDAMARSTKAGVADLDILKMSAPLRIAAGMEAGGDTVSKLIADLKQAIEKHPKDDELWVLLAASYGVSGDKKSAFDALEKAVEAKPDSYRPRLYLAVEYDEAGRKQDAEKQLAEAERLRPKGAAGFRAFGAVYLEGSEIDRAIKELKRALELEPDDARAHILLGQAYAQKLDLINARTHLEKALAAEPKSALLLSGLCRLTNLLQDNDRLIKYATQWSGADPDSYEAHQYLRIAYLKTGQQDKAAAEAKLLSNLSPTHASFFFLTGNSLIQAASFGNSALLDEAVAVLAKGHTAFPDDKGISSLLNLARGMKLVQQQEWHRAIIALKKSAAATNIPNILLDCSGLLSHCYMETGQLDKAAENLNKVMEIVPQSAPNLLEVFQRAKRYDYAAAAVTIAIKSNPKDLRLQESLINSYATVGRWDDAKAFVESLPATTADECTRRIYLGAMFADRMESRRRVDAATKLAYLDTLMQQTRDLAKKSGAVEEAYLDALALWLKSSQPWLVAGPFSGDGGLDGPLPPENSIDPDARYKGLDSSDIGWRVVTVRPGNTLDLQRLFPLSKTVVAYAATYIQSGEDQTVTLRFAGRDPVKVWLGDKMILQTQYGGPERAVEAALQKGANRLLIKTIDNPTVDWAFEVRAAGDQRLPAAVSWSSDADTELGAARALAYELLDKFVLKDEVLARLKNDATISAPLREAATKIADKFTDDPRALNQASWQVVIDPDRSADEFALALRQAETASNSDKSNWIFLTTLGAAQQRAGNSEDALTTLKRAQELCRLVTGVAAPSQLAFIAMAQHKLKQSDESRESFTRLGDLMRGEYRASDSESQALLREVKSVFKESTSDGDKNAAEIEAIKAEFVAADEAGWLHHDLDAFMEFWADGAQHAVGRGEKPGPYDVTCDHQKFKAIQSLYFQGDLSPEFRIDYQKLDVDVNGETATLNFSNVVNFGSGYQTCDGTRELRKTADGWKAVKDRRWIANSNLDKKPTIYDDNTLKQLDDIVEQRRAAGDLRELAQAFFDAHRFIEAHAVTKELTSKADAPVSDWRMRGSVALQACDPADSIDAFKKASALELSASPVACDERATTMILPAPDAI